MRRKICIYRTIHKIQYSLNLIRIILYIVSYFWFNIAFGLSKNLILLVQTCSLIMYRKHSWKQYGIIKVDVLSLYEKSDNYTPQSDNENFTILRGNCKFIKTIKWHNNTSWHISRHLLGILWYKFSRKQCVLYGLDFKQIRILAA